MKAMEPDRIQGVSHELGISQDDSLEREAMISRRVMRKARPGGEQIEPETGGSGFAGAINAGLVMRAGHGDIASDVDVKVSRAAEGAGQSLPDDLRGKFESSLGTDLGGVRVHTHSAAAEASESLGARAYAVGQDVFMGAGEYNPGSAEGAHLLAHEVAHTVQQRGAASGPQMKLEVSSPGDAHEHDADSAADAMIRGEKTSVMTSTGISRKIQRDLHGRSHGHGHGDGHGHGATTGGATTTGGGATTTGAATTTTGGATTTTGAATTTTGGTTTTTGAAATTTAPTHTAEQLEDILNDIPHTWQDICDAQIQAVNDVEREIGTADAPSMAETLVAGMVNAAVGAAVGQIATVIGQSAGRIVQAIISAGTATATAPGGAACGTTACDPAAAAATPPLAGAAGTIATWITDKIKDRIKSDLELSAGTLAGATAGQPAVTQFANAQRTALLNAKTSAREEFVANKHRFRTGAHGFEEAQGLQRANVQTAQTRANPSQHAASLAEWARSGAGNRISGMGDLLAVIAGFRSADSALLVNVDMPEPSSNVSVASSSWPALNDASRAALVARHGGMRIEELNPAMRIRIYTQRWRPFIGESYFDLTKIPGQTNVEFEHSGSPLMFLYQRQNPHGSPSSDPLDLQLSAAQVAAQMIWLGIWQSNVSRLGNIGG